MPPENERLPCRGCTRECLNYTVCDGRPWRLGEVLRQSLGWADLRSGDNSAATRGVERAL